MRILGNTSDAERRQLVGTVAAAVAVLLILTDGFNLFIIANTGVSLLDRVLSVTENGVYVGGFAMAAALLLMLDSESESTLMKVAIMVTGLVGALLMLGYVVGLAAEFTAHQSSAVDSLNVTTATYETFLVVYRLPQFVLGLAAL